MDEQSLAERARGGDTGAFGALVTRYRKRAYGYFMARTGDAELAEDLCQEAFLGAFRAMAGLRNPASFGSWFFAVCANLLRAARAARSKEAARTEPFDDGVAYGRAEWEAYPDTARVALGLLPAELRELVALRHDCGLGYAAIAASLGIEEALVKSRLFRARERLRELRADIEAGLMAEPGTGEKIEGEVMDRIESLKRRAFYIERLSLPQQVELCAHADGNEAFGAGILATIGAIEGGKEWIVAVEAKLSFPELIDALNYVDRFTEKRVVDALDAANPALAAKLKQHLFVFEDFILFDASALRLLVERSDRDTLALALASSDRMVLDHFLANADAATAADFCARIVGARGDRMRIEAARFETVAVAQALDLAGELYVERAGEAENGRPVFRARAQ